jgi:hypothetical protein
VLFFDVVKMIFDSYVSLIYWTADGGVVVLIKTTAVASIAANLTFRSRILNEYAIH